MNEQLVTIRRKILMTTITLDIPEHLIPSINSIGDQLSLVLEMGFSRLAPFSTKAYVEAVDFLTQDPSPQMISEFRFSDDIETRINNLLEKNRDGQLSKAEEVELDRLVKLEDRLQFIKAKALVSLNKSI